MHALIFLVVAFIARAFKSKDTGAIMLILGAVLGVVVLMRVLNGGALLPHVFGPIILIVTGIMWLAHTRSRKD